MNARKFLMVLVVVLLLAVTVLPAFASPQSECEAQGGTYTNNQGTKTCVITSTSPAGNSNGFQSTNQESQQGNVGIQGTSDTNEQSSTCANPGGNPIGSTTNPHC